MTPHLKNYAIKYHWFEEHVQASHVTLVEIATRHQLAEWFTKGLSLASCTHLSLLMSW